MARLVSYNFCVYAQNRRDAGDEADVDCSGSCSPCTATTHVLALPSPSPACPLTSLAYRLAGIGEACAGTIMAGSTGRASNKRTDCTVDCAAAFVPFFGDCVQMLDLVYRTSDCVDASGAEMLKKTGGVVPNCHNAKANGLRPWP